MTLKILNRCTLGETGVSDHFMKECLWAPKVILEWLALLLRIREVPGSNLGLKTGYPD
jgi:hypothetical protein